MADKSDSSRDPLRRVVLAGGPILLGAVTGGMTAQGGAELTQSSRSAKPLDL